MKIVIQGADGAQSEIETNGEVVYLIQCGTVDNPARMQEMRELNRALHTEIAADGVFKMVMTAFPVTVHRIG